MFELEIDNYRSPEQISLNKLLNEKIAKQNKEIIEYLSTNNQFIGVLVYFIHNNLKYYVHIESHEYTVFENSLKSKSQLKHDINPSDLDKLLKKEQSNNESDLNKIKLFLKSEKSFSKATSAAKRKLFMETTLKNKFPNYPGILMKNGISSQNFQAFIDTFWTELYR